MSASWVPPMRPSPSTCIRGLRGLPDVQVVARYAAAERHRLRTHSTRWASDTAQFGDVKRLRALARHAHVGDARIVGSRNFGDGVRKISLVLQRHEVFDQGDRAARSATTRQRGVTRASGWVADAKSKCTGAASATLRGTHDQSAIIEKCGVKRGECIVVECRVPPQWILGITDLVPVRALRRPSTLRRRNRWHGKLRRIYAIDEREPHARFGQHETRRCRKRPAPMPRAPVWKRNFGQRRDVREAPVFIASCGRNRRRAHAVDRMRAQIVERRDAASPGRDGLPAGRQDSCSWRLRSCARPVLPPCTGASSLTQS